MIISHIQVVRRASRSRKRASAAGVLVFVVNVGRADLSNQLRSHQFEGERQANGPSPADDTTQITQSPQLIEPRLAASLGLTDRREKQAGKRSDQSCWYSIEDESIVPRDRTLSRQPVPDDLESWENTYPWRDEAMLLVAQLLPSRIAGVCLATNR